MSQAVGKVVPEILENLASLEERFDLFLFDQYGVLHDGVSPSAGAIDGVAALKAGAKRIVVISNSGKRADLNADRLSGFGFGPSLVDAVYTSGELVWRKLRALTVEREASPMTLCHLGNGSDRGAVADLPIVCVPQPEEAELLLIAGRGDGFSTPDDYRAWLRPAAEAGVTAWCSNPDRVSLTGGGSRTLGPGGIAAIYESLGGRCAYFGKPHPALFRYAMEEQAAQAERTVVIGDSLEHDILGAMRAGCASVLVRTGIHADLSDEELRKLMDELGVWPDFLLTLD